MTGGRDAAVLLAFDYGNRRIGVASGNLHTRTATALTTIETGRDVAWRKIDALLEEWRPDVLIVGVPEGSSGPTAITERARQFASSLGERYGLPVETVDEALTSAAAASELREGRRSGLRRRRVDKKNIDMYAACHIAEQWMTEAARP